MVTVPRLLAVVAVVALVAAATAAAAAQSLKPQWSRPVGGKTRLVGVEEYGRCSVFVDNGAIQIVSTAGNVAWTWPFRGISKYINPIEVAVSHECDAIAFAGDASYKYVWIVDRAGTSASIKFVATPAGVAFDRNGTLVAVGTYAGSMFLYSRNGTLLWKRDTEAAIVNELDFTDDNQRILFKGWGGAGIVSVAGQVEWSQLANGLVAARDLGTFVFPYEPNHGPGPSGIALTDGRRRELWNRDGVPKAFISADGARVLTHLSGPMLMTRSGEIVRAYENYRWPIALSEDGSRAWLRGEETIDCVDEHGQLLATIAAAPGSRGVRVSRDFGQVLIVTEKDLDPVSIERYEVPRPCKP